MVESKWDMVPFYSMVNLKNKVEKSNRYIALEDMIPKRGKLTNIDWTDRELVKEGTSFNKGDILFGKLRPYLAKSFLSTENGVAVGDIHVYSPKDSSLSGFVSYVVQSAFFVDSVNNASRGTKMPRTEWGFISQMRIPLPPLETQQRIADYLDRETAQIDDNVSNLNAYVELLKQRRQVLITDAVTGRVDSNGNRVEGGQKWDMVPLRYYGKVNPSTPEFSNLSNGEVVSFLGLEDIWGKSTDYSKSKNWLGTNESYTKFRSGDILVPKVTPTVFHGRSTVSEINTHLGLATSEVFAIRINSNCDSRWLNYNMLTSVFLDRARGEVYGVGGLQRISSQYLSSYPIRKTSLDEQKRIADYLDRETAEIDALIEDSTQLRDILLKRRQVLITEVVTGKKEV